jgi:hypothetical protein
MANDAGSAGQFKQIPANAGSEDERTPTEDTAGEREAVALDAGTLEDQTKALTQSLRKHVNWAVLLLIWLSAALIAVALIIAAFHHLTPWGWLTEIQLAVLDTFLFSGALVSTAGRYIVARVF